MVAPCTLTYHAVPRAQHYIVLMVMMMVVMMVVIMMVMMQTPTLQYLFYVNQIGITMSPCRSNVVGVSRVRLRG